jgi:hypothetical protein
MKHALFYSASEGIFNKFAQLYQNSGSEKGGMQK